MKITPAGVLGVLVTGATAAAGAWLWKTKIAPALDGMKKSANTIEKAAEVVTQNAPAIETAARAAESATRAADGLDGTLRAIDEAGKAVGLPPILRYDAK